MRNPFPPSRIMARSPTSLIAANCNLPCSRKRNLEFARHTVGEFLVQKSERHASRIGGTSNGFFGRIPAQRTRGYVTNRVVAGFARRQPNIGQLVQQIRDLRQRDKMILNVLASGEVPLATANSSATRPI